MFMSNDPIYQGGQGATTERRSQITGGQRGVIRSRAGPLARLRFVPASSLSVFGRGRAAQTAGPDYRGDRSDELLLEGNAELSEAAQSLSRDFDLSLRQAYRYLEEAARLKQPVPITEVTVPITLKLQIARASCRA